jgi:hypothetical protein
MPNLWRRSCAPSARPRSPGRLGLAIEVVTTLAEHGTKTTAPAVAFLEELVRSMDPAAKPWPSPQLDNALIRLLKARGPDRDRRPAAERALDETKTSRRARRARGAADEGRERRRESRRAAPLGALPLLALPQVRGGALEIAGGFLDPLYPLEVQTRVIDALAPCPEAASTLCARFGGLSRPAREKVLAALLARPAAAAVLLDALAAGDIKMAELGPRRCTACATTRTRPRPRAPARCSRSSAAARTSTSEADRRAAAAVDRPGDAGRGRELARRTAAIAHGEGRRDARRRRARPHGHGRPGARELLPFLIDPNRAVEPATSEYVVETTGGELVDGVIARETGDAI